MASFTSGIQRLDFNGRRLPPLPTPHACRVARSDFDHTRILVAREGGSLALLKPDGQLLNTLAIPGNALAVVLGALGEYGAFGLPDGTATFVEIG